MNVSPFVIRELRVALRRHARGGRFIAAAIVTSVVIVSLPFAIDHSQRKVGHVLYDILLILGVAGVVLGGEKASYLFADERRNGTLSLLFGTGITAGEVLLGKLAGAIILPLSWLLTILPGLVIVWLMQGATSQVCFATTMLFAILLGLSLGLNLFASLIFEEHSSARTFADAALVALVLSLPAINGLNRLLTGSSLAEHWMALSPGYGPWLLFRDPQSLSLTYVFLSCGYSALYCAGLFTVSTWLVGRIWKDQVGDATRAPALFRRMLLFLRMKKNASAKRWLEINPYHWLIIRDFSPALMSWATMVGLLSLWLAGLSVWGKAWLNPINFWLTFLVMGGAVRWMISYIAARQIGRDRASGNLELLLTSGLSVQEILLGQRTALHGYFKPIYVFLGILLVIFLLTGLLTKPLTGLALMNYYLIWLTVAVFGLWIDFNAYWTSFWISLNTGRPGYAQRQQVWQRGAFLWVYLQAFLNRDKLGDIPTGSFGESSVVLILSAGLLLTLWIYKMGWLKNEGLMEAAAAEHMRVIAAEPLPELNDQRLKNWDKTRPLIRGGSLEEKLTR